ncbi:hypothetical protein Vadar_002639 [Vaccinium darrowii]|uniref:Uncharacterized protein n=1 Tax=Vaccinium darrowii TaxID=229202 RepID=A0ACB7XNF6_9ERIC|nr:hypothetical protein Vadar_002639 [Vaccinium darrowii]
MNQKLILAFCNSGSLYSLDCQATDHTVAKLELPCKSLIRLLGSFHGVLLLGIADILCLWNPSIRMYQKFSPPKYRGGDIPMYGLGYDSVGDDFKMSDEELCLWNPSIRMFRKFSSPELNGIPMYGLGYDSVSDDFKVVRILWPYSDDVPCPVHVFSSKLSLWKSIGNCSYDIPDDVPGTVLNGSPHWVVGGDIDITRYSIKLIVCFDATEEKFKEVPKPCCRGWGGCDGVEFGEVSDLQPETKQIQVDWCPSGVY